jgi:hypothetical protein
MKAVTEQRSARPFFAMSTAFLGYLLGRLVRHEHRALINSPALLAGGQGVLHLGTSGDSAGDSY